MKLVIRFLVVYRAVAFYQFTVLLCSVVSFYIMGYIVDFEAYQVGSLYYPKEVAFLNIDTNECFQYYIHWSWHVRDKTTHWQQKRHGMDWIDGKLSIHEAVEEARTHILLTDVLWVKGLQKRNYLQTYWFPHNTIKEIEHAPALKNLNNFHDKTCMLHLGKKFCARRKVYELRPYIHNLHRVESWDDFCRAASIMSMDENPLPVIVHDYGEGFCEDINFDCASVKSGDLGFYDVDDSDDITDAISQ